MEFQQSKLDNWYAIELSKRFGTQDTKKLRTAEKKYWITTDKAIVYKWIPMVSIRDRSMNVIAQQPISYFFT